MAFRRTIYIADTARIKLGPLYEADGTTPLTLTGLSIDLTLRRNGAASDAVSFNETTNAAQLELSGASTNYLTWTLTAANTAALTAGDYTGVITIDDGAGTVKSYPDAESGPMLLRVRERRGL